MQRRVKRANAMQGNKRIKTVNIILKRRYNLVDGLTEKTLGINDMRIKSEKEECN